MDDEGQYNRLRKKAIQEVLIVSDGQIIQPSTIVVQVESKKFNCCKVTAF
jgi:hypothetical protein